MATYKQIETWVYENHGFKPKSCWIAHAKEISGLPVRRHPNRVGERTNPCPQNKLLSIQEAFKYFHMKQK